MSRDSPFQRFRQLKPSGKLLVIEAGFALAAAAAAVAILPFRKAVKLGSLTQATGTRRPSSVDTDEIIWSVKAVAARVPWRAMCFERGLAVQWMLRRRGLDAKLVYGARLGQEAGLDAHVWVTLRDRILIGGEQADEFHSLATHPEWSA